FHVEKHIPVSAGVGGGSANAAAALRLLAAHNRLGNPDTALRGLAAKIGADVPVCLAGDGPAAAFMSGIGDNVVRPEPDGLLGNCHVYAVLANPGVAMPTGAVFAALGAAAVTMPPPPGVAPARFEDNAALFAYLDRTGNDLEAPAIELAPVISDVLAALRALDSCRLSRMTGSGATCFGLFETKSAALDSAEQLRTRFSEWWIGVSRLS
ncbi:MAG: 4-(cytidine 5'-diphospho)-2-C-methyl-D-erythritol kinase, partial [Hyphomicrobiaceae bacterium]